MSRLGVIETDGIRQAILMISRHLGLDKEKIASLSDEAFLDAAAEAYFYEKRMAETVKEGLVAGIVAIFKGD